MSNFKSNYLNTSNIPKLPGSLTDVGVTLDSLEGENISNVNFGPFNPATDIGKYNLGVYTEEDKIHKTYGHLIQIIAYNTNIKMNFENFMSLYTYKNKIISKFQS
jgi:hypothetical protein